MTGWRICKNVKQAIEFLDHCEKVRARKRQKTENNSVRWKISDKFSVNRAANEDHLGQTWSKETN